MCYGFQRARLVQKKSVIQTQRDLLAWVFFAHTRTHFSSLWCILASGVLCFSSHGREESGPGSKLTINSTLLKPETRSNTSTPSLLPLLLPPLSSSPDHWSVVMLSGLGRFHPPLCLFFLSLASIDPFSCTLFVEKKLFFPAGKMWRHFFWGGGGGS